jgi:hypothetical protein
MTKPSPAFLTKASTADACKIEDLKQGYATSTRTTAGRLGNRPSTARTQRSRCWSYSSGKSRLLFSESFDQSSDPFDGNLVNSTINLIKFVQLQKFNRQFEFLGLKREQQHFAERFSLFALVIMPD